MLTKFAARFLSLGLFVFALSTTVSAQGNQYKIIPPNPKPDDDTERILTEEIKLNVAVRNDFGHFDPSLRLEDLMVVEDRVPHTIASLRRVPASVLIVMDTGGESKLAKNLKTTRETAFNLVQALDKGNSLALMHFSDKPEILVEWTNDKNQILQSIMTKSNFGRRSRFVEAMNMATKFLANRPNENRHLILITDGTDSVAGKSDREKAFKNLLAANITVHVLSYTALEIGEMKDGGILRQGDGRIPKRTDETHKASLPQPIQDLMNLPRLGSITIDPAMIRARKQRKEALKLSQEQLNTLAIESGGEMIIPASLQEMTQQAAEVADTINSQYVITYVPKRALADADAGEVREIGVIPRRVGLVVQARRKFTVPEKQ